MALLSGKYAAVTYFSSAGYSTCFAYVTCERPPQQGEPTEGEGACTGDVVGDGIPGYSENAFWNAFLVGSGSIWDTDKTKRALEGNIVLNLLMSIGPYPLLLLLLRSLLLRWLRVRVCQ